MTINTIGNLVASDVRTVAPRAARIFGFEGIDLHDRAIRGHGLATADDVEGNPTHHEIRKAISVLESCPF
jgi:hypothetical protein